MIAAALLAAAGLANASFEEPGELPPGWTVGIGATVAAPGGASLMAVDREVARDGRASLRLEGGAGASVWHMLSQTVPVKAGDRVVFSVAVRSRGVRVEGGQKRADHVVLLFHSAEGERLGIVGSASVLGDRDWVDLHAQALAPPRSATVQAGVFLSTSGRVWFDDARLRIAPTRPLDAEARRAALDALALHLDRTYPHFGAPGRAALEDLPRDAAGANFPAALRAMLMPLQDVHVWIDGPQGRLYTAGGDARPLNANLVAVDARLAPVEAKSGPHVAGRAGDVGYLRIGSFAREHQEWVESALGRLADARALVLDVRTNGGGDEAFAQRIAARFAEREFAYVRGQARDPALPGRDGFLDPVERKLAPSGVRDLRKVVVLQGPFTVSAGEAFLLMMRPLAHVTTLGAPSRGSMGNPQPFPVTGEYSVWVPTRREVAPDGKRIEGHGVAPEVALDAPREAFDGRDPVFERALELLAK